MISEIDNAYAAGLIDGEGCIYGYKQKNVHALSVVVAMSDRNIVQWLVDTYGGRLYEEKVRPGRKPMYRWTRCNADAKMFLEKVIPYLKVKSLEAWLGIAWPVNIHGKHLSVEQKELRTELAMAMVEAKR